VCSLCARGVGRPGGGLSITREQVTKRCAALFPPVLCQINFQLYYCTTTAIGADRYKDRGAALRFLPFPFITLPSFILFRLPTIMRFSTLIAFMLPLSALGAPACFDCVHPQSETDIAVKVFTDGLRQTNLGLFNMVPSAMSVSDNMVKAIQGVERILNQAIPRAPTSLPSEQECVDTPPHWSG